jgi:hypothetical protein
MAILYVAVSVLVLENVVKSENPALEEIARGPR